MTTEKVVNYSEKQVSRLLECVPFDYAKAQELGKELGKHPRSIVAKVKRMENDETVNPDGKPFYIAKPAYTPKTGAVVVKKSDIVKDIATILAAPIRVGLEKADKRSLELLRADIVAAAKGDAEAAAEAEAEAAVGSE